MADPVYTTLDDVKAALELTGYTAQDDFITQQIATASRAVDKACDRRFFPLDEADAIRYFSPRYANACEIDDCYSLTSVYADMNGDGTYDVEWVINTDFLPKPDNADADGRPWERIVVRPWASHSQWPYWNPQSVQVTGRFGWESAPDQVVSLAMLLATRLVIRVKMAPLGVQGIGVDGAVRIASTDPEMAPLIRDLSRAPVFF